MLQGVVFTRSTPLLHDFSSFTHVGDASLLVHMFSIVALEFSMRHFRSVGCTECGECPDFLFKSLEVGNPLGLEVITGSQGNYIVTCGFGSLCRHIQIRQDGELFIDVIVSCKSESVGIVGGGATVHFNYVAWRKTWMFRFIGYMVGTEVSSVASVQEEGESGRLCRFAVLRAWLAIYSRKSVGWSM